MHSYKAYSIPLTRGVSSYAYTHAAVLPVIKTVTVLCIVAVMALSTLHTSQTKTLMEFKTTLYTIRNNGTLTRTKLSGKLRKAK